MDSHCCICLQKFVNPVKLFCGHTFCFLCVKGAANVNKRCAVCRNEIPENYFEKPVLVNVNCVEAPMFDNEYQWFYEGRDGWWLYDKRTGKQLETAFKNGTKRCELLIAGFLYVIDFEASLQYRRNEPHRKRRIKRDHPDNRCTKGVAGIRILPQASQPIPETESEDTKLSDESCTESSSTNVQTNVASNVEDELSSQLNESLTLNRRDYHETFL
ncbi:E3 ubiquitin-protein ligase RNF146-like isoform X1 [Leptotrombidium deliense]|uniref:E3 ubiquitin-protein ligase n=1 Tax=Leptotrombidium deliense TaxID=299467 RepID=A0A443SR35_9ACAR|nr:E3 ubiquitin-protein ligase RNF146-like isoform X1 [Leptotrombidium deliense]